MAHKKGAGNTKNKRDSNPKPDIEKIVQLIETTSRLWRLIDEIDYQLQGYQGDLDGLAGWIDDFEIYLKIYLKKNYLDYDSDRDFLDYDSDRDFQ